MMRSVDTICEELDVKLNPIPDWNCCSASIGYANGGVLPRMTLTARNLAFSESEKSQEMIHDIIEAAYDHGADMIVTPCPLCKSNVEIYEDEINSKFGSKFDMPVVYYSQLNSVAYGRSAADAALDGQIIKAENLEEIAAK